MPRLQILELPMEHDDHPSMDSAPPRTPFALVLDDLNAEAAAQLRARPDVLNAFAKACGARTIGVFEYTVDIA